MELRELKGLDDHRLNHIILKFIVDFTEVAYYLPIGRTGGEGRWQKKGLKMH